MATLKSSLVVSLNDRMSGPARGVVRSIAMMKHEARGFARGQMAMGAGLFSGLRGVMALGAGYIGLREGISGTIGKAMKFEDAMSDIRKVVDFKSPRQFSDMRKDILGLSQTLPVTAEGLAAITAAAGQANIPMNELMKFTEMTAKVSTAWDLSAGETGESMAKMKTALGLTLGETELLADAINHLSNNSAASAPNILRFSRGLASGKQAGFAAKETLAFGAAMIGSGFEAEVAETSFRNMTKALTAGSGATKAQRKAFKTLGMDNRKVSRAMQKDAVGTTLAVFEQIRKLPKHQQGAVATALFGSEARALPALIGNLDELRRTLGLVNDDTAYAGSASKEYEQAAKRTSNTLALLKNNLSAIGVGLGDNALPTINDWAKTLADTLSTLDSRVTVFDKLGTGMKGFMSGLGFDGASVGEQFGKLYDGIFGRLETFEGDTDRLGVIFLQFREWGASVRDFGSAVSESIAGIEQFFHLDPGTIGDTLGMLGGMGFKLTLGAIGISAAASAVMALGRSIMFLSGASLLIGGAKGIGRVMGALTGLGGAKAATTLGSAATGAGAGAASTSGGAGVLAPLAALLASGVAAVYSVQKLYGAMKDDPKLTNALAKTSFDAATPFLDAHAAWAQNGDAMVAGPNPSGTIFPQQKSTAMPISQRQADESALGGVDFTDWKLEQAKKEAARVAANSESALGGFAKPAQGNGQSSGVQQVQVMNQPVPNITVSVNAPITVNEAANGAAIAGQLGSSLKSAIHGVMGDLEHAAGQ